MTKSTDQVDPLLDEEAPSRYIIGIDLGTTNSSVAYVDTQSDPWSIATFSIAQLIAAGQVESRESLPSFHYESAAEEFDAQALQLNWSEQEEKNCVGVMARDHGALVPGRMIASAKSWLCHTGVDRTRELLPWHGAEDVTKLTPVEVSARYLKHLRLAWDAQHPDEPMAEQDIVLTLPASFDEIARELTVQAAKESGLSRVVLIEEPQAAFYSWIDRHRDDWTSCVKAGQNILVCDVGGGTSDFTMIRVTESDAEEAGVAFHRLAVGEHLILGGDNLDLALARSVEAKISAKRKLSGRQWDYLLGQCRSIKESMLSDAPPASSTVHMPSSGSKLMGGSLKAEVKQEEVESLLLGGFFPHVSLDQKPETQSSGFQEFGLPYATDPAVTKYLAQFLRLCGQTLEAKEEATHGGYAKPDIILFNGGVFSSEKIQQRVLQVLTSWFQDEQQPDAYSPIVFDNQRLDLAVAQGAAYYGMARRGSGVKITAGLSRTYYIGVGAEPPTALCLIPAGTEPGQDIEISQREFKLQIGRPVEFPLYSSATRLNDRAGELVKVDSEQLSSLAPIRTVIKATQQSDSSNLSVRLHSRLTEIGTMELWCAEVDSDRSWKLQFDVRSAIQTEVESHRGEGETRGFIEESSWQACEALLRETFSLESDASPDGLMKRMAKSLDTPKNEWPPSLLRRVWETLMDLNEGRRKSAKHEARWLNLMGFSLRPGYGVALDDWRVSETWRLLQGKLIHPALACRAESWILWRRIAGGLASGQQEALALPLANSVRQLHRQMTTGRGKGASFDFGSHEAAEIWRLLGSLERLPLKQKVELGQMLVEILPKKRIQPTRIGVVWALGRLGARVPVYGLLNHVIDPRTVSVWLEQLLTLPCKDSIDHFALMQMSRLVNDRYRDVDDDLRQNVIDRLSKQGAETHLGHLVRDGGQLDEEEQRQVFGEALPVGLQIA